jgi:hypothetical protein
MTRTIEKIAVIPLYGVYNVHTYNSSRGAWDVQVLMTLLPNEIEKGVDCGMVIERALVDVVTTPEGKVIDIRFDLQSIGYLAVRTYCQTAGITPPLMIQAFDDFEDPELQQIIDNNGVYLLPLLGEAV